MERGIQRALEVLSREQGMPVEQIVREMEKAIAEGLRVSKQTGNVSAMKMWNEIPRKGEVPTAEEFIDYCCRVLYQRRSEWRDDN